MSYRNPKQIVDTQSGQHVTNMIKSITGSYDKMANSIADTELDLAKSKAAEMAKKAAAEQVRMKGINTKTQAYATTLDSKLKPDFNINLDAFAKFPKLYNENLKKNPATLSSEDNMKVIDQNAVFLNLPDLLQKGLGNAQAIMDEYDEAIKLDPKAFGSYYSGQMLKDANGEDVAPGKVYDILTGRDDGTVVGGFDMDSRQVTVEVKDDKGTVLGRFTPNKDGSMPTVQTVPKVGQNFTDINTQIEKELELDNRNSPAYAGQAFEKRLMPDGTTSYFKRPSKDVYKQAAQKHIDKLISGLPAGDAIALHGAKFVNNDPKQFIPYKKEWDDDSDEDKKRIKEIKEAAVNFLVNGYMSKSKTVDFGTSKPAGSGSGSETKADKLNAASEGFAVMLYDLGEDLSYNNLESVADNLSLSNAEQVVDVETNPWVSLEKESVSKEFRGPSSRKASFKKGDSPKQMAIKAISVKYGYNPNEATKVYEESLKKVEILKKRYKDVESEFEKSASSGLKGDARAAMKKAYIKRHFRTTF